jgi:hypothetical protein
MKEGVYNMAYNYYEVEFNDGYSICIKGKRQPSIEEANEFLKEDCKNLKVFVTNVIEIDNYEAHEFFDMEHEEKYPVFQ